MADANGPIKYMDRTRHYYRALGYTRDYIWANFDDVPFSQPAKPLSEMRIVLITTASPPDFDGVKRVWSGQVSPPPPKLFTDNVAWDKESTHTNDRASFLPIEVASELASQGLFGGLAARSTACLLSTASVKRLRKMRRKFSRAFAKIGRTPQFYVPFVLFAIRPSACGSSPRNERDSYCHRRIGTGRCRALRCSKVLFHGLSARQSLRSSVAA